jgi:hypothetical protein
MIFPQFVVPFTFLEISRLAALLDFMEILGETHFPMGHELQVGLL